MSEEVRATVGLSRGGPVRLVEEHAQGGRTRTDIVPASEYAFQGQFEVGCKYGASHVVIIEVLLGGKND
jgi:hypothetical protein